MQARPAWVCALALVVGLSGCRLGDKADDASAGDPGVPAPTANNAPTISGRPATTAKVNTAYSFQPSAADADGDTLTFSIANKPAWASFDSKSGRLYGTPSASSGGVFNNVQITVTDGKASAALPAFAIAVSDTAVTGSATLFWDAPTTNSDGSALTDLAGYSIRYGNNMAVLDQKIAITNPGVTTHVIDNLPAGTWYFTLATVNKAGVESRLANPVSITIG